MTKPKIAMASTIRGGARAGACTAGSGGRASGKTHAPSTGDESTWIWAYDNLPGTGHPAPHGAGSMAKISGFNHLRKIGVLVFALAAVAVLTAPSAAAVSPNRYTVTALVSDHAMGGATVDGNLRNAWGLVAGPTTPWWVSDNGADLSTLYT